MPWVGTALHRAVPYLCVRILRDIAMAEHGVELAHRDLPSAPCAHTLALLDAASHPRVSMPSGPATGARCPSRLCTPQQWLSHGAAPVAWSAIVHDTTVSIDALDVSLVRSVGPTRAALWAHAAPSRYGLTGGVRGR